jgi:hypothetical protein
MTTVEAAMVFVIILALAVGVWALTGISLEVIRESKEERADG